MADITTPNTFAAGTPLDPAPVAENTFGPESLPQNMAALNGRLNRSNLVAPATVTRDMVRSGSFLTGRTDGVTTNLDYFYNLYAGDWTLNPTLSASAERALGVPGASQTYYAPYNCVGVYFTWHISTICEQKGTPEVDLTTNAGHIRAIVYIDGEPVFPLSRQFKVSTATLIPRTGANPANQPYNANVWYPDHRWWSGHLVLDTTNSTDCVPVGNKQPYAKGWHTIEIRVAHPHKHLRIKTRRMTAIPFR